MINEWEEIAAVAHSRGIPFIVDGVALFGKAPFKIPPGVTGMAFSAIRSMAPKGSALSTCAKGPSLPL